MTADAEREAFEAWVRGWVNEYPSTRGPLIWDAWRARAALPAPKPDAVVDDLVKRLSVEPWQMGSNDDDRRTRVIEEREESLARITADAAVIAAKNAEIERLKQECDEATNWSHVVDRHGVDGFDALAETWLAMEPIARMNNAVTSVFQKWANDELMTRFKAHIVTVMHTSFVEGALVGVRAEMVKSAAAAARTAELQAEVDRLRDYITYADATAAMDGESIYIASKSEHGKRWRDLRAAGVPIISTWIDESEVGATSDWRSLWTRCTIEAAQCRALIVYREPGETLKGAWVEVGAALAAGRPVYAVGIEDFSVRHHPGITICCDMDAALSSALNTGGSDAG